MIDWLWLWLAGIMQRRQLKRVLALEEAADAAMRSAEPCYPQDCDAECAQHIAPRYLGSGPLFHYQELRGSQALRPQQLSALQQAGQEFTAFGSLNQQQMQSARGFGVLLGGLGGAMGTVAGGSVGGAFGNTFGKLLGDGRKH